jgi:hypothetical protein
MPKRDRNVLKVPFKFLSAGTVTLSAGVNTQTYDLSPALVARLVDISDAYALYRFTNIRATLMNPGPAGASTAESVAQVLAYNSEPTDTAPVNAVQTFYCEHSIVSGFHNQIGSESAPSQYRTNPPMLNLSRKTLTRDNASQWWKTKVSANVESYEEIQGQLFLVTDSSASSSSVVGFCVLLEGFIEFACPNAAGMTPLEPASTKARPVAVQSARPTKC